MNKKWVLTQESFDMLLGWLHTDEEQAGKKYEDIRNRLIKLFTCRGCNEAEDLADETINRVTQKVFEIAPTYTGDPALYFYGVAHKVHLEFLRRKRPEPHAAPAPEPEEQEQAERDYACLERCMERLSPANRELVLQYYREDKQAKIDHRKLLAQQLGIALNALRIRAHRIRATLQQCVAECIQKRAAG